MSRLDSPGHVALLFAGAAIVSLLLVALLTAEARTRKALRAEPHIENTNLFSSVGRRVASMFSSPESSAPTPPHRPAASAPDLEVMSVRRRGRDLKSVVVTRPENASDVTWWRGAPAATPPHHRHHHSGERRPHHHPPHQPPGGGGHNTTVENSAGAGGVAAPSDTCYGPNEVLLIIAVTCAVNFAFIFGVMTIVHLCNVRGRRHSNENLSSIVSVGHSESLTLAEGVKVRRGSCGHDGSLPGSMTLLLLPELEEPRGWQLGPRRLSQYSQYQPLLAHSMEDLHILE